MARNLQGHSTLIHQQDFNCISNFYISHSNTHFLPRYLETLQLSIYTKMSTFTFELRVSFHSWRRHCQIGGDPK